MLGWGVPTLPVATWAIIMAVKAGPGKCWRSHGSMSIIWILESSKLIMLLLTFVCFFVIIHSLRANSSHMTRRELARMKRDIVLAFGFCLFSAVSLVFVLITTHAPPSDYSSTPPFQNPGYAYDDRAIFFVPTCSYAFHASVLMCLVFCIFSTFTCM